MSDNRRNKKYSNRHQNQKDNKNDEFPPVIQPKILLKSKIEKDSTKECQISIATREQKKTQNNINLGINNSSPSDSQLPSVTPTSIQIKEPAQPSQTEENIAEMTRPITILTYASNQINPNATKALIKNNTDFLVVGVIGCQGVGKSTILNILALDQINDFEELYTNLFESYEGVIFPVRMKPTKGPSLPRTESLHMFINYKDRIILLDNSPVLCNSNRKDGTTNEIDDLRNITFIFTVCHLVLVVQDDYFNINLMRLLQFAEITKSHQHDGKFLNDYFPNIIFIKNKAKRIDFLQDTKARNEKMLKYFFKDSKLKVYFGQNDNQKKLKLPDDERPINCIVFPEVKGKELISHHPSLNIIISEFRNRVYMTPRNQICNGSNELTEGIWFELLQSVVMNKNDFFLTAYEEIRRYRTHSTEPQI